MKNLTSQNEFNLQKPPYDALRKVISTDLGRLHIRGPVDPKLLSQYQLSEGLNCFRPPKRQHEALIELAKQEDGLIFAAILANKVISYLSFQKPEFPWWIRRCFPKLLELGSMETDLSWRKIGLSKTLMNAIFINKDFNFFENFIVIAVHTVHSWDLKNTCLDPWSYRNIMLKMFKQYNFVTWETEDPEVREHPCNILLARVGANIDPEEIKHFSNCCLGLNSQN